MSKVVLRNPTFSNIKLSFDTHGDNPQHFEIPAGEIKEFNEEYAWFVKKHIYDAVINERKLNGIALNANPELKQKIMDEILVQI